MGMALPPKFAGTAKQLAAPQASSHPSSIPTATHTFEIYLDYVCPFSAKQFKTLQSVVFPLVKANPQWASSLTFIFRQQVQPWHPSSTLVHEAGLAVLQIAPDKFWTLVRSSLTTKRRTLTSTLSTRHATQPTVASPTSLAPSASTRTSSTRCWSSRTSQARTAR